MCAPHTQTSAPCRSRTWIWGTAWPRPSPAAAGSASTASAEPRAGVTCASETRSDSPGGCPPHQQTTFKPQRSIKCVLSGLGVWRAPIMARPPESLVGGEQAMSDAGSDRDALADLPLSSLPVKRLRIQVRPHPGSPLRLGVRRRGTGVQVCCCLLDMRHRCGRFGHRSTLACKPGALTAASAAACVLAIMQLPPEQRRGLQGSQAQYVRVPLASGTLLKVPRGTCRGILGSLTFRGQSCRDGRPEPCWYTQQALGPTLSGHLHASLPSLWAWLSWTLYTWYVDTITVICYCRKAIRVRICVCGCVCPACCAAT